MKASGGLPLEYLEKYSDHIVEIPSDLRDNFIIKTQQKYLMKAFDKLKTNENNNIINKPITVEVIQNMVGDLVITCKTVDK